MEYKRYGQFRISDYWSSWISIACLLIFSFAGGIVDMPLYLSIFAAVYALVWFLTICLPHCEKYRISPKTIEARKWMTKDIIVIPDEIILVVSPVDISPPFTRRTAIGNTTHILSSKLAITILRNMPVDTLLMDLHRNRIRKYTTSIIQMSIAPHNLVYSFVYEKNVFEHLLSNAKCRIVVPRSLLNKTEFVNNLPDVYIDERY